MHKKCLHLYIFLGTSGIAINLIGPDDNAFLQQLLDHGISINPLPG
jgi:hypothetical protein